MENQDFSLDHSISEDEPLTHPHFDDEVTIQSARPVVPLHEVKRASRTKNRLLLGGALCVAAVIGFFAASFVSQPRSVQDSTTANTNETSTLSADFVAPSSEAGGATVNPNAAIALDSEAKTTGADLNIESKASSVHQPQTRNTRSERKVEKEVPAAQVIEPDDQDVPVDEEFRRGRREARRLRRERRINERRAGDETTRIREIFEGSPRP